ncbi:MAG: hypothetical protein A2137_01645 [Chloroflexi bacterium RBG_16_58_8]|nr:MAG: hypothetical protein A2137_01645 [Chloroflexi bacterium RBG_16_58_8]
MPLSDRDYMKNPPPRRGSIKPGRRINYGGANLNPVWTLIAVNFVFFIATIINSNIIGTLGLSPSHFAQRPWTLLTNMFVHEGFWHVFGNMITLYFFGTFLNRLVGQNKFLLVYFAGGILGGILYVLLGAPYSIAIGASGAVYAVAGALAVMMPNLKVRLYFILPVPLWLVVLVFFVLWSFLPGIAWPAHLGGLAAGLIGGYFFRRRGGYYYQR